MFWRKKKVKEQEIILQMEKKSWLQKFRELKERNAFIRYATNIYVVTAFIFLIYVTFIEKQNLISMVSNYLDIKKQEQMIYNYHKSIIETDNRLRELSSNRDSLERFARERFHFHKDDEDVFLLVE